jgi:ATP-dependent DNA helicase RecG
MAAFKSGEAKVLVATTVIEVGVDVPEASIMVVEHAERFGLAQLHQLRGRVGRGAARSTCLLLLSSAAGGNRQATARGLARHRRRFRHCRGRPETEGAGELLGTKQSGLPEFHFADLTAHGDLLVAARDDARLIVLRGAA